MHLCSPRFSLHATSPLLPTPPPVPVGQGSYRSLEMRRCNLMLQCLHFEAMMHAIGFGYVAVIRIMLITVLIIIIVLIVVAIVVDMTMNAY